VAHRLNRRAFLKTTGLSLLSASVAGCSLLKGNGEPNRARDSSKPNIVLIVGDDLTWRDIGCYGSATQLTFSYGHIAMPPSSTRTSSYPAFLRISAAS
jgi:hypothetical protein